MNQWAGAGAEAGAGVRAGAGEGAVFKIGQKLSGKPAMYMKKENLFYWNHVTDK